MKKYYLVLSTQTILRGNIPEQNVAGTYPREVQEERDRAFTCHKARTIQTPISTAEYNNGLNDGREFSPEKKLA